MAEREPPELRSRPPEPETMAYAVPDDLRAVRAFVADRASALGLAEARVDLLTLAVSELATNTLQHTSGGGRVRVWADGGQVVCDVVDSSSGEAPVRAFGRAMPGADALRGRGLAIVERVCDTVDVGAVDGGTRVRIRLNL
jgi:anti-sigma regulatory factor (Ser/Thr protein kinase)